MNTETISLVIDSSGKVRLDCASLGELQNALKFFSATATQQNKTAKQIPSENIEIKKERAVSRRRQIHNKWTEEEAAHFFSIVNNPSKVVTLDRFLLRRHNYDTLYAYWHKFKHKNKTGLWANQFPALKNVREEAEAVRERLENPRNAGFLASGQLGGAGAVSSPSVFGR